MKWGTAGNDGVTEYGPRAALACGPRDHGTLHVAECAGRGTSRSVGYQSRTAGKNSEIKSS
jgi:hypothetical protein